MHPDHLTGMLKALKPVITNQNRAKELLQRYWRDRIALVWTTADVFKAANERQTVLSPSEARQILQVLFNGHNKQYGLKWEDLINRILDSGFGRKITRKELSQFIHQNIVAIDKKKTK